MINVQWHTPMGYCVRDGQIVVDEVHSKIVEQIFRDYDSGISATQIAKVLKEEGVMNKHDRVKWTHATVGRILDNHNYLGTEHYPRFIDEELFRRVQEQREERRQRMSHGKYRPEKRERILFGGVLKCGTCGEPYGHHAQTKKGKRLTSKWKCKNYVYHNQLCCAGGFISDSEVMDVCTRVINQIINDKKLIQNIPATSDCVTPQYRVLNEKIKQIGEEVETTATLLFKRAAERYLTLEVKDIEERTQVMLEAIEGVAELESFDEKLYRKLIKEIIVNKNSTATVVFYNGSRMTTEYGKQHGILRSERSCG